MERVRKDQYPLVAECSTKFPLPDIKQVIDALCYLIFLNLYLSLGHVFIIYQSFLQPMYHEERK